MEFSAKSFNPNKHLKEEFVSNLTGSSMLEIFALTTVLQVIVLIRHSLGFNCGIDHGKEISLKKNDGQMVALRDPRAYMVNLFLDFLTVVFPIIVIITALAEWTYTNAILSILLLLSSLTYHKHRPPLHQERSGNSLRDYISSYRVSMMLVTCLCILAVDFKLFPRRFAKTESYGTSLMDLGVGSFVLANSLVSRQAQGVLAMKLKSVLLSTSPLLFLGIARLVFTTGVDYQVHVGEYGVHWNFFFTLAAVAILTSIVNIPPNYCGMLGLLILVGYQVCLMCGLNIYLLSGERGTDIFSQNKEGIFSIFGYWGLYLVGVQLGNYLFFGGRTISWTRSRVWILFVFFWCLTLILDDYAERASRRMCNLTYVTLVLAVNLQVLAIIMLSDNMAGQKLSSLEEAINRNLLGVFLVANLLTGLINLSIDTLSASSLSALAILIVYLFVACAAAGFADFYGIRLKF